MLSLTNWTGENQQQRREKTEKRKNIKLFSEINVETKDKKEK